MDAIKLFIEATVMFIYGYRLYPKHLLTSNIIEVSGKRPFLYNRLCI